MLDHAMMCLDNMMTHTSRRVGNRASGCERFEKNCYGAVAPYTFL